MSGTTERARAADAFGARRAEKVAGSARLARDVAAFVEAGGEIRRFGPTRAREPDFRKFQIREASADSARKASRKRRAAGGVRPAKRRRPARPSGPDIRKPRVEPRKMVAVLRAVEQVRVSPGASRTDSDRAARRRIAAAALTMLGAPAAQVAEALGVAKGTVWHLRSRTRVVERMTAAAIARGA